MSAEVERNREDFGSGVPADHALRRARTVSHLGDSCTDGAAAMARALSAAYCAGRNSTPL